MRTPHLFAALAIAAASAAAPGSLVVTDNGSVAPADYATGFTGPANSRYGWDDFEPYGQSFTLDAPIVLDSIYIAYNEFLDYTGVQFTITIDGGNAHNATLDAADFSGNDADGFSPVYWMRWDLSSSNIALAAGSHAFDIDMTSEGSAGAPTNTWPLAAMYNNNGASYAGGSEQGLPGGGDMLFAVSQQTVSLTNGSFELPDAGSGGFISGAPTGWVHNGTGAAGVIDENRSAVTDTPDGDQWAHVQSTGNQIGQAIGTGLELLKREFLVEYLATRRTNETLSLDHDVLIMAGSDSTFVGGVVLDSVNYDTDLSASNTFNDIALSLTALGDVGANTQLWLVFQNNITGTGQQLHLDAVSLKISSIIPAPAALPAGLSLLGLAAVRRRRRR